MINNNNKMRLAQPTLTSVNRRRLLVVGDKTTMMSMLLHGRVQLLVCLFIILLLLSLAPSSNGFLVPSSAMIVTKNPAFYYDSTSGNTEQSTSSRLFFPSNPKHNRVHTTYSSCNNHQFFSTASTRRRMRTMTTTMMINYDDLMEKLPSKAVIEAVESLSSSSSAGGRGKSSSAPAVIIASDVAAAAGVSVATARKELTALAALSQGDIAVDATQGELLYKFPSNNLSMVLANNSAKYKALQTWQTKVWPALFWFVRVSFGVTLLVSLAAIFSTIFFLQSSSSDDRRDNGNNSNNNGGGGGMPSFGGSYLWGPSPLDFFYWNRPYGYYATTDPTAARRHRRKPPGEEMGFLPSIFSYVFGDGNPNEGLEERRLALVANCIRNNQGAVTAEQLAPFCDNAPSPTEFAEKTYVDESFVLPIVTALNGEPQVTEEGDIVYVFPELQVSASSASAAASSSALFSKQSQKALTEQKEAILLQQAGLPADATAGEIKRLLTYNGIDTRGALERSDLMDVLAQVLPPPSASTKALLEELEATSQTDLLQEREYKFSIASDLNKFLAAGLGVVNLGGALWLGNLLGQYSAVYRNMALPGYMGAVQQFFPILLAYAILFNAIPAARNVWIQRQNAAIAKRNQTRQEWKKVLQQTLTQAASRDTRLGRKLRAAARMGSRVKQLGAKDSDILFDTSKPLEENKQKKVQKDLEDFDKLLSSDDNSSFQ